MTRLRTRSLAHVALVLGLIAPALGADEKKKGDDKAPRVTLATPLAVAIGETTSIKVRGLHLADATEVRTPGAKPGVKLVIKSKGKAEVSQGLEAADVGDTQVEVELTLPADVPAGDLPLVIVTPAGETKIYDLAVLPAASLTAEKEPNDGFRQAQELSVSKTVTGAVQGGDDVDVFRFEVKSGQKLMAEVVAARRGSALDSLLTLYDSSGHVLATNDDDVGAGDASTDSVLHFHCPSDGTYYLSLTDANARGGPAHGYLLSLKAEP